MPLIPAYTIGGFTRPELHTDNAGNIILDPVAAAFAAAYGTKALYLGLPANTPFPPIPDSVSTPVDSNGSANSIAEGAAAGTAVGIAAQATSSAGFAVTYSLTGDTSGGGFAINPTTGVVTVANAAKIDFESSTGHAYNITVQANDGVLTSSQSFTIGVSDVAPSTPTDSNAGANTVVEGAANGTPVGITVVATDVNGAAPSGLTYSLTDDSNGRFTIDSTTGVVTVLDSTQIDFESSSSTGHTYSIIARASDGTLLSTTQTFTINVTNAGPQHQSSNATAAVNEGTPTSAVVYQATANDPSGGTVTYSLSGGDFAAFSINSSTGAVTFNAVPDFEVKDTYTFNVLASDGLIATPQAVTIHVANVAPSTPVDSNNSANTVVEGAANGTAVDVTASSFDPGAGPAVIYSLTDNAGGRFAIDPGNGVVTVADASLIDFEGSGGTSAVDGSYSITVQASDGAGGTSTETTFTIKVTDAPPANWSDVNLNANTVVEGAANGTTVGVSAHAVDPNSGAVTYTLAVNPNNAFAIDGTSGVITVANGNAIDFESTAVAGHQYTLTVKAADAKGLFTTNDFLIDVTNAPPPAPTDTDPVAGDSGSIAEGIVGGATPTPGNLVGITAHSAEPTGGAIIYSLSNDAGGLFDIDQTTGVVFVKTGAVIDYENTAAAGHQYVISVLASDGTQSSTENFTVNVTNVAPSQPTDSNGAPGGTVQINAADGTPVGITLAATDPGAAGGVTYAITDPSGNFAVDPDTGVVTLRAGHPALTPVTTYTITAVASDGTTQGPTQTFDIFVPNNALNIDLDGNDSGGVIGNGYAASFTEQGTATPVADTDDVISNTGNPGVTNATSATIVLTNAQAGDSLLVNGALPGGIGQITSAGGGQITITLSGTASYANYQAALHQIQFGTSGDAPNTTPRILTVTVTDSTGTSPVAVSTIAVSSANDPPTLTLTPVGAVSYTENAAPTALFSGGSVTDPDAPGEFSGGSYTATITNPAGGDQLVLLGSSGFSAVGSSILLGGNTIGTIQAGTNLGTSNVVIDFNSFATPAVVNQLAHAFGFQNSSEDPSTTARIVNFTFNDGNHSHTDAGSVAQNSNVVTQTVNVIAVNDTPTAVDDTAATQAEDNGAPWTISGSSLTTNDFTGLSGLNETGQSLTVIGASNAVGGSVSVVAGNVVFTPTANFNGAASFDYTVQDNGQTNGVDDFKTTTGHVTFTVTEVNDAPTATNDTLSDIAEDSAARTIALSALTGNDSAGPANEAGQALTITNVSNGVGGSVQIVGGNVVFTPTADFNGVASFDYTVTDNGTTNGVADAQSSASPGHVTFNVTPVNDAPVTVADALTPSVAEDSGARTILFSELTGNDSPGPVDETAQTLTVIGVSNAIGGTVVITGGHVEFTPAADFNGTASFDYTVRDNGTTNGAADPKTAGGHASFTVTELNDAPTGIDDVLAPVAKDSAARVIQFSELTADDSKGPANESGQTLTITAVDTAVGGSVAIVSGHIEFTPTAGFTGPASFHYTVEDNGTDNGVAAPLSSGATASFEIGAIALDLDANDSAGAPGADYAVLVTSLATPLAIADADTSIIDPTSATLNTATVTITTGFVSGGEDILAFMANAGTGDITAAAFDTSTGVLTLTSAGGADAATWQAALHAVTYRDTATVPTSTADRTITVSVSDGVATSNIATTTVHFEANDAPVAADDTLSAVAEDSGLRTIQFADLTANDSAGPPYESAQTLTVTTVSSAVGGTVAIVGGHVEFTPTADFNGTASFDYTVQDNGTTLGNPDPKTDVGHVSFTVTSVNDAPVPVVDPLTSIAEDSGIDTIAFTDLTGNDSAGPPDEASQTLTVIGVSNAVGGAVAIVGGHVEFTPSANFNGAASFDYTVRDNGTSNGVSDPRTAVGHATINVSEVNDAPVPVADSLSAVDEDSGVRTITFAELTGNDSPGPTNESAQLLTVTAVSNAVGGSVAIVSGQVKFTPAANFNGIASFDYTVQDNGTTAGAGDFKTALGHASFTVTPVNDAPVLDLDTSDGSVLTGFSTNYTVSATPVAIAPATISITDAEDSTVNSATVTLINAQTNDVLGISGALPAGINSTITPGAGTITVSLSGSATLAQYQTAIHQIVFSNGSAFPDPTIGDRIVTVVMDDGHLANHASNTASTTIHLTQDTPPVANAKTASASEAGGVNNGTAGSNGSGNVITDAVADSDAENPALVVSAVNGSGAAVGNALGGTYGTLTLNADGSYSYAVNNANTSVQGLRLGTDTLTDTFSYTIRDTAGLTSSANLTITIHGANDNPFAVSDTPTATEAGTAAGVNPGGNVLTNDTDVDSTANGETRTVQGVAAGTQAGPLGGNVGGAGVAGNYGTLTIAADGTYSYVVNNANTTVQALRTSAQTLTDTFSYTMHDAASATSTAQVTVTIQGQNDAPIANADTATATEAGGTNNGTAGTNISNFNVLTGVGTGSVADTDPDSAANGETQTVQGVETGTHLSDTVTTGVGSPLAGSYGTLTLNSNGSYSYTVDNANTTVQALNNGTHVNDIFTYTMRDQVGVTSTTTLNIQVNGANDAPVGVADSAVVFMGKATTPSINLLTNDTDIDTPAANLTAVKDTNPAHGSVVVNANGSFTYTGNAGYLGADSFTYHVADNGSPNLSSATVTVTLDVQPLVWHVDNTASAVGEDGSAAHPWHSIAAFNTANAAASIATRPDIIYLHNGTGTYSEADGFNLKDDQTLLGQGVNLSYVRSDNAQTVVLLIADNTQIPTIIATAGDGIDLGQNNTVKGLHIGNASGVGIADSGGTVGNLTISGVDINSTGQAIDIDQGAGTLSVSLTSVTSSGGAQGIQLAGVMTGTFAVTTGTLSGHTGSEFDVNGGAGAISYGGTIGNGTGLSASIANRTGGSVTLSGNINDNNDAGGGITVSNSTGTIDFTGTVKTLNTGASNAVALTNNNGAVINFTGGGLDIDTTSGTGFSATGAGPLATSGGTVTVTGTGNSISSSSATALNISNTTIGASNVTFRDISANGAVNGIVLNNTVSSGGLTVTGTGTTAGSGGTIQHTTGSGISITSASNLSLANMMLNNNGDAINENGIRATELTGTASITNTTVTASYHANVLVKNTSGNLTLNVTGSTFTSSVTHDGMDVFADNSGSGIASTALITTNISNSTFSNNFSDGFFGGTGDNTSTASAKSATTITSSHFVSNGANGIAIVEAGSADTWFNIHDNTDITGNPSNGINLFMNNQTTTAGQLRGMVANNTVNYNTNNGGGVDLMLNTQGAGKATIEITNNTFNYADGSNSAVIIQSGDGTGSQIPGNLTGHTIVKFTGNTVNMTDTGATNNFALRAINIESGLTSASTRTINLNLGAAGASDDNHVNLDARSVTNGVEALRVRERPNSDFTIVGLTPSPATTATDVKNYIASVTGLAVASIFVSGPATFEINYSNAPADTTAAQAPLLAAAGGVQSSSPTPGETHLTQVQLDSVVAAAIAQWAHAGASASQLAALYATTFSVADLTGNTVGVQSQAHITIDTDAAGHGWFVDPTPSDNSEFTHAANAAGTDLLTDPSNAAAGHLDLLTTVSHELGHLLGLPDLTASADAHDLMYIDLLDGERRLPNAGDVAQANVNQAQTSQAAAPAQAPLAPIVRGTAGNDTIDAGHGGKILVGEAGADSFVFANVDVHASAPPPLTHVADYHFAEGDSFDFSVLTSAFHGSGMVDPSVVRAVEDASNTFATLQVNTGNWALGSKLGPTWVSVAQIDGAHAGDPVSVLIDNGTLHHAQIHVDLLV